MAYSDYGAYVWKNGIDITKSVADKNYFYFKNEKKWYDYNALPDDMDIGKGVHAGGHAVLLLNNDFAVCFYKTLNPTIVFKSGKKIELKVLENLEYKNKRLSLDINGMYVDSDESIIEYTLKYKNDIYSIYIGSQIGNGLDNTYTSKFIKKYNTFDKEREIYILKHKYVINADVWQALDYFGRKDQIKFLRYSRWEFAIKPFLSDLIRFRFHNAVFHMQEIKEKNTQIKLLK